MTPLKPTAGLTITVDHLDWAGHPYRRKICSIGQAKVNCHAEDSLPLISKTGCAARETEAFEHIPNIGIFSALGNGKVKIY